MGFLGYILGYSKQEEAAPQAAAGDTCLGCRKGCSLTSPKCGRGRKLAKSAGIAPDSNR
jgi:hypothetical protein